MKLATLACCTRLTLPSPKEKSGMAFAGTRISCCLAIMVKSWLWWATAAICDHDDDDLTAAESPRLKVGEVGARVEDAIKAKSFKDKVLKIEVQRAGTVVAVDGQTGAVDCLGLPVSLVATGWLGGTRAGNRGRYTKSDAWKGGSCGFCISYNCDGFVWHKFDHTKFDHSPILVDVPRFEISGMVGKCSSASISRRIARMVTLRLPSNSVGAQSGAFLKQSLRVDVWF